MSQISLLPHRIGFLLTLGTLAVQATEVLSADLKPETLQAFSRYVEATEARIDKELRRPGAFLYVEGLPEPRRSKVFAELKKGEIFMERLEALDASGRKITAPSGLIHHWIGAVFIPGASLPQVRDLVEDYDHHQDNYKPEVVRSQLKSRDGDDFKMFYRLRKHKVITVTLNTEHDVHYVPMDSTRLRSRSIAARRVPLRRGPSRASPLESIRGAQAGRNLYGAPRSLGCLRPEDHRSEQPHPPLDRRGLYSWRLASPSAQFG